MLFQQARCSGPAAKQQAGNHLIERWLWVPVIRDELHKWKPFDALKEVQPEALLRQQRG